eukprot:gb/GECG01014196.1/.p1 GENE.gb/GECG01014196.1/~~gb/GECG01014196.1/.p1  ORF type:complete len:799 (+),score=62.25 gb/GECG01014196.1/:1-2397(+)
MMGASKLKWVTIMLLYLLWSPVSAVSPPEENDELEGAAAGSWGEDQEVQGRSSKYTPGTLFLRQSIYLKDVDTNMQTRRQLEETSGAAMHRPSPFSFLDEEAHPRNLFATSAMPQWMEGVVIAILASSVMGLIRCLWEYMKTYHYRKRRPFSFRVSKELGLDSTTYALPESTTHRPDRFHFYLEMNLQLLVIQHEQQNVYESLLSYFHTNSARVRHICPGIRRHPLTLRLRYLASSFATVLQRTSSDNADQSGAVPNEWLIDHQFVIQRGEWIQAFFCLGRTLDPTHLEVHAYLNLKRNVFREWCDMIARSESYRQIVRLACPPLSVEAGFGAHSVDPDYVPVDITWSDMETAWIDLIGEENIDLSLIKVEPNVACPVEFTAGATDQVDRRREQRSFEPLKLSEFRQTNYGFRLTAGALLRASTEGVFNRFCMKATVPSNRLPQLTDCLSCELHVSSWDQRLLKAAEYRERLRLWCSDQNRQDVIRSIGVPQAWLNLPQINSVNTSLASEESGLTWKAGEQCFWEGLFSFSNVFVVLCESSPIEFSHGPDSSRICVNQLVGSSHERSVRPTEATLYNRNIGDTCLVRFNFELICTENLHYGIEHHRTLTLGPIKSNVALDWTGLPPLHKRDCLHTLYQSWTLASLFNCASHSPGVGTALSECYQTLTLHVDAPKNNGNDVEAAQLLPPGNLWHLFEGPAGVGKTTLFKCFAQLWSSGANHIGEKLRDNFSWVIFIQLYHLMYIEETDGHSALASLLSMSYMKLMKTSFGETSGSVKITPDEADRILRHLQNQSDSVLL